MMAMAMQMTGQAVDRIPVARPAMMLVAAPVDESLTMSSTARLPLAV